MLFYISSKQIFVYNKLYRAYTMYTIQCMYTIHCIVYIHANRYYIL